MCKPCARFSDLWSSCWILKCKKSHQCNWNRAKSVDCGECIWKARKNKLKRNIWSMWNLWKDKFLFLGCHIVLIGMGHVSVYWPGCLLDLSYFQLHRPSSMFSIWVPIPTAFCYPKKATTTTKRLKFANGDGILSWQKYWEQRMIANSFTATQATASVVFAPPGHRLSTFMFINWTPV